MGQHPAVWASPADHLRRQQPDHPVLFFAPGALHDLARQFVDGFPGLSTYAVKANPNGYVVENLIEAGVGAFDVASPKEIAAVRALSPDAPLHYNNPVRSRAEIAFAVEQGAASYSVDSFHEFEKLRALVPAGTEVAVRFKLPVEGAAYDFGSKFGADMDKAVGLLQAVVLAGFTPALNFHPGTQCNLPENWRAHIVAAARIARAARVQIARLNVGGGFASWRTPEERPRLEAIFAEIQSAVTENFGSAHPALLCEPGRAMVADAFSLATRVRGMNDDGDVYLNDGIYGALSELALVGMASRVEIMRMDGETPSGPRRERRLFGPTCDSVDMLPAPLALPEDLREGDYIVFHGLGAYSTTTATAFNGFGDVETVSVLGLGA